MAAVPRDLVRSERAARLLERGPRHFCPKGAVAIPLEFADAAYRYGHSQMRDRYQLQPGGPALKLMPDLIGFRPTPPDRVVHWPLLLDVPGQPRAQRARAIDGRLPNSLIHLPRDITGTVDEDDQASLALRDLLRGTDTGLPSGEAVARQVGEARRWLPRRSASPPWAGRARPPFGTTSCARRRSARTGNGWVRSDR